MERFVRGSNSEVNNFKAALQVREDVSCRFSLTTKSDRSSSLQDLPVQTIHIVALIKSLNSFYSRAQNNQSWVQSRDKTWKKNSQSLGERKRVKKKCLDKRKNKCICKMLCTTWIQREKQCRLKTIRKLKIVKYQSLLLFSPAHSLISTTLPSNTWNRNGYNLLKSSKDLAKDSQIIVRFYSQKLPGW